MGGKVAGTSFVVELAELGGRARLKDYKVCSAIVFD
jgi:adenine/guanine phosphoribosyltransferase-like PRPP-binding protein